LPHRPSIHLFVDSTGIGVVIYSVLGRIWVMSDIKLIVGLGNPGVKYEGTRHNIGFMIVDRLVARAGVEMSNHLRWRAHVGKLPAVGGAGAIVMKPQTFMNLSGQSVGAALRFYKWEPEQVLVVYDDISLPFGSLRFRAAGSAGGHNGIKSVISHLGSERFPRLKVGIGERPLEADQAKDAGYSVGSGSLVGHVLGKFSTEECNELENTLATAAEAVQFALSEGVQAAANSFNTKKKIGKKQKAKSKEMPRDAQPNTNSTNEPLT